MFLLRKIIFYSFLLAYIILCAGLLFYAFGYSINPLTREVERTGMLHLSTIPSGAAVYLEQSRFTNKTPTTIDELRPGRYRVRLELAGYRPWSCDFTVSAGKAAVLDKVILIPRPLRATPLLSGTFKQLWPLPGTGYFLVSRDRNLGTFYLYDWKDAKAVPLVDAPSPLCGFPVLSVFHEDDSRVLVIHGGGLWERKYLYVDLKGDKPVITDITKLFASDPLLIQWDPADPNDLFAVYANYIDRLKVSEAAVYPKYLENVKGGGFANNRIFLMTVDNGFVKYGHEKGTAEPLFESAHFEETSLRKNLFFHIIFPEPDWGMILSEDGQLLTSYAPYRLEERGVVGMKFNEQEKTLAYWTRDTVKVAQLSQERGALGSSLELGSMLVGGEDIRQCFWMLDNNHLVCNDNDKVFLIEAESQGSQRVELIAGIKKGSSIFYTDATGRLYFLDERGVLSTAQLIPQEGLVDHILNNGQKGR